VLKIFDLMISELNMWINWWWIPTD